MELCVVDWKAITPICAALIASCMALYISNRWNSQKGSEVVANEAKQTIKDLLEIINISYKMDSYKASPELVVEKFKQFEILSEQILRSSLFIDECIVIDNFSAEIDKLNKVFWEVKDIALMFSVERDQQQFKDILSNKVNYVGSVGTQMAIILIPYSTYQKKFIFKKKS